METKRSFTLNCGELTFTLRKEDVSFYNGYGIVKTIIDNNNILIGVVDKNYKQVLPLTSTNYAPKLFIASDGNFVFVGFNSEIEIYQVFHIDIKGNEINLGANDFLALNNEIIQLYYDNYSTLYDIQTREFLIPFYHYVGPFVYSEKYGCKVARATFYVEDENNNVVNEVSTIINVRGEVLENYYDLAHGREIESKDPTIVLDLVRRK